MQSERSSRRRFLGNVGTVAGSAWLSAALPAISAAAAKAADAADNQAEFEVLGSAQAKTLAAIAAQIIPTDEQPGATEAGVIYFMDAALGSFMSGALETINDALPAFDAGAKRQFAGSSGFVDLDTAQQIAYLQKHEQSPLFGLVQFLTTLGMFSMPSYGGNRAHTGWDLIGFRHQHVWLPPFGYYDHPDQRDKDGDGDE